MSYSRLGYLALKVEVTENTAIKPDVFVPFMSEDIVTQWGNTPAMPVSANRALNLRPVQKAVEAPSGTVNVLLEPKTLGYFLRGIFGAVTSGRYFPISSLVGTFTVGETVTGGTSSATATVLAVSAEGDYLIMGAPTGTFTAAGEALTGGSSGATANLGVNAGTVYGHQFTGPQNSLPTFTVEIGFQNEAYRYTGVRFNALSSLAQSDNIITAAIGLTARAAFTQARVTAVLTTGSGSKTITLDQTTGLAASDTIKVYRPGTGFLDFSASSVKTHTINSVASETSITVTDLQTALAVGDLIVIAPQTPSYSIDSEFSWIGGSTVKTSTTPTLALAATADSIEDFELVLTNEIEGRHGANGTNKINLFPATNFLKGLTGSGKLTRTYTDPTYLDQLRNQTLRSLEVKHTGSQIASTGVYHSVSWRVPDIRLEPFNANVTEDDLLGQEMEFNMFYSTSSAYLMKAILVNANTAY